MITAWSVEDVRAAEQVAMADLPPGRLMRRAAKGLAQVALARLADLDATRVVVLVGPGDNGGDALYAAARVSAKGYPVVAVHGDWDVHERALLRAKAAGVTVLRDGRSARADGPHDGPTQGSNRSGDLARSGDQAGAGDQAAAGDQADGGDQAGRRAQVLEAVAEADLVIDGILGIGGRPGLPGVARAWVARVPEDAYVLAVDVPSGQDPSGAGGVVSDAVFADETVTFGGPKPVHLLPGTAQACGLLTVVEIGVDLHGTAPVVERLDHDDVRELWPVPGPSDDKYSRGVLGIVAGGEQYTGAAVLATSAAASVGAGMVRYVGTGRPTALVRAAVPEAVIGAGRVQAWVVGPGLDVGARGAQAADQIAAAREALTSEVAVLVDAGGLDLLDTDVLASRRDRPTLLTPHAGELARLLGRLDGTSVERAEVESRPAAHAQRLADLTGATVLLKGAVTLVCDPAAADTAVRTQADAPSWLATAGAGDVLAGICGALLAAGLSPRDAGSLGALVHGVAADRANPGGPVRASRVVEALPGTVAALLTRRV